MSQPSFTKARASSGDAKRVNSSTSAPAMKLSLAERMTRPLGAIARVASRAASSSCRASLENVLADSPALSKVSQARPFGSWSRRQCL